MKYYILYRTAQIRSPTQRIEIDAESFDEAIYKFKEIFNIPFGYAHVAIFNDKMENIYEGQLDFPHILTQEEREIRDRQESLPKRIEKAKAILRDCGIRMKVVCYDYESEITFEYKGEKILDGDDCKIDMFDDDDDDNDVEYDRESI